MSMTQIQTGSIVNIHSTIRQELTKLELRIFDWFAYLSNIADQEGRSYITPSYATIARKAECCEKTVQRATETFARLGLIRKQRRNPLGWGRWRTNLYQVNEAVRKWARKHYRRRRRWGAAHRRTFVSAIPQWELNYRSKERNKAPPGDSLSEKKLVKKVWDRLNQAARRRRPANPTD